jgi:anti-sigma B factor antagonist
MYLVVRSLDFADHTISLEVDRSITKAHFDHLAKYIGFCTDLGFANIDIHYPTQMPAMSFLMLQELQKKRRDGEPLTLTPDADPSPRSSSTCSFECVESQDNDHRHVVYRLKCDDLPNVLNHLVTTVLLVGSSVPLDDESLSRLRLCVYELGVNTVEHGVFHTDRTEVGMTLVVKNDCVEVTYVDNAEEFSTASDRLVDVADNIKLRKKRGLGLYLLQQIAVGLEYEREADWNKTRFSIKQKDGVSYDLDRRTRMDKLTITVIPTDSNDTVVMRPSGSINSTTVPELNSSLDELMDSGRHTIVVDLSETDFISSSGVGLLLGTVSSLREKGGDLVLMNIPNLVNDIFDILNIKMHFRLIEDLNELKVVAKP